MSDSVTYTVDEETPSAEEPAQPSTPSRPSAYDAETRPPASRAEASHYRGGRGRGQQAGPERSMTCADLCNKWATIVCSNLRDLCILLCALLSCLAEYVCCPCVYLRDAWRKCQARGDQNEYAAKLKRAQEDKILFNEALDNDEECGEDPEEIMRRIATEGREIDNRIAQHQREYDDVTNQLNKSVKTEDYKKHANRIASYMTLVKPLSRDEIEANEIRKKMINDQTDSLEADLQEGIEMGSGGIKPLNLPYESKRQEIDDAYVQQYMAKRQLKKSAQSGKRVVQPVPSVHTQFPVHNLPPRSAAQAPPPGQLVVKPNGRTGY